MLRERIFIEKPINEVWDFVVLEMAKNFKCSPSQLKNKVRKTMTTDFSKQKIEITQSISIYDKEKKLEVLSESDQDIVRMAYEFTKEKEGTLLTTYEYGKAKNSKLRTINFWFLTLPLINKKTKNRLRQRLESIKMMLENENQKI